MKNAVRSIVFVIGCLFVANVFATTTFEEIPLKNGSIVVRQWQKTLKKEFITEPVPNDLSLSKEQKEKLWQGGSLVIKKTDLSIKQILHHPLIEKIRTDGVVSWHDGNYHIGKFILVEKVYNSTIISGVLIFISIVALFFSAVGTYKSKEIMSFDVILFNIVSFGILPSFATIGGNCLYVADQLIANGLLAHICGVIGIVILIVILIGSILMVCFFGFANNIDTCVSNSIFVRVTSIIILIMFSIALIFISIIVFIDSNSIGVVLQWIVYLVGCIIGIPLACSVGKMTVNVMNVHHS